MTNPKHTSSDLAKRLYEQADRRHGSIGALRSLEWEAADRIEALEAENERLHGIIKTAWFFASRLTLIAVGLTIIWSVLP
jgi:hypothetical protein